MPRHAPARQTDRPPICAPEITYSIARISRSRPTVPARNPEHDTVEGQSMFWFIMAIFFAIAGGIALIVARSTANKAKTAAAGYQDAA